MNRRQFLKCALASGATAVVARGLWQGVVRAERSGVLIHTGNWGGDLPDEWAVLHAMEVYATEGTVQRAALFSLARSDAWPLLRFSLNTHGGHCHWQANPWSGLVILRSQPLLIEADFDGVAVLACSGERPFVERLVLTRERGVTARHTTLLENPVLQNLLERDS